MIQSIIQALPQNTKRLALYLFVIFVALMSRATAPWLFWISLTTLVGHALVIISIPLLKRPRGKTILSGTVLLLIIHVAWAILRASSYEPTGNTFWHDDSNYFPESIAIANTWERGHYPDISQKGSSPHLGTLHTGYHRSLASAFYLFGVSTFAGLLINAFSTSLIPFLCAVCVVNLWPNASPSQPRTLRDDLPFVAFLLAALHPNQFYWSAYMLKDSFTAFIVLLSLALLLYALARKDLAISLAAGITIIFLFSVRAYAALSIVMGVACLPLFKFTSKTVIQILLFGAAALFLLCVYTDSGNKIYEQLRDSLISLTPRHLNSAHAILEQIVVGTPRLFLSPFAWVFVEPWNPLYGMYPGMWYLYLVIFPLSFCGLYYAISHNIKPTIILISVFGCASLLFLTSVFEGNASRQRYYLEYICILFASLGLRFPNRYWIAGILAVEAAFAIGQLISLKM